MKYVRIIAVLLSGLAFLALAVYTPYRIATNTTAKPGMAKPAVVGWTGKYNVTGAWWVDWHVSRTDVSVGVIEGDPVNTHWLLFDPDERSVSFAKRIRPFPGVSWMSVYGWTGRLHVKHWLLMVIFAVLPGWSLWRWWKGRHQRLPGHCLQCGYDMRQTPGRCSECGWVRGAASTGHGVP